MPYKKGHTNNPEGRPKGSRNARSLQWETLAKDIIGRHSERFNKVLDNLDDEEFARQYTTILNYFKPRLASTQMQGQADINITIKAPDGTDYLQDD